MKIFITFFLAVSPASICYNETLSTLRYAQRAKNIVNKPKINEVSMSVKKQGLISTNCFLKVESEQGSVKFFSKLKNSK